MPTWLFWLLVGVACVLVAAIFVFILFPRWFVANPDPASNMNRARESLVKADKNKTYRIGIYVDGDLSEVFFALLKTNLQRYKLPVVFTPLHKEAARNLLVEGEWLNRIACPDGQVVDAVLLAELNENFYHLTTDKPRLFHHLKMSFYYPNGAYHGEFYWESHSAIHEALRELARMGTFRAVNTLYWIIWNPTPAPDFTADANAWPYGDSEATFAYPQNTPQ